jgi:hypothetical protein
MCFSTSPEGPTTITNNGLEVPETPSPPSTPLIEPRPNLLQRLLRALHIIPPARQVSDFSMRAYEYQLCKSCLST